MFPAPRRARAARGPVSYGPERPARNPAWALILLILLSFAGFARAEAPVRILAIGDSLTHGYGLPQDLGLVPQLQRWLAENGAPQAQLVNMGVSGDTTAGGKARLAWALGDGGDAVILELGANDMLRGIDPAQTRANLSAMLDEVGARGLPVLLVGMRAADNFGPDYRTAFDAIYPDLAARGGILLYPWFFEGLVGDPAMFQEDGLHPSPAGVAEVVRRLGPKVLELIAQVPR